MEFLGHLAPPGDLLKTYNRQASYRDQPTSNNPSDQIPQVFLDAMSVRDLVFVQEQKCALEQEYDADDARSWHWVCYASVATAGSSGPAVQKGFGASSSPPPATGSSKQHDRRRSTATASKLPVGVIRLVPPPHPPHPAPGSRHGIDNSEASADAPAEVPPSVHTHVPGTRDVPGLGPVDGDEPYVKIGRVAILPAYRKLGLAKLLVDAACHWASQHATEIVPKVEATVRERAHARQRSEILLDGRPTSDTLRDDLSPDESARDAADVPLGPWKGLVLVHAQAHLEKLYGKWGFVRDPGLGTWHEEGIEHIGMWKRLAIKEQR